jgi:hypothetical protein
MHLEGIKYLGVSLVMAKGFEFWQFGIESIYYLE